MVEPPEIAMKRRLVTAFWLLALLAAGTALAAEPAPVRVFDAGELTLDRYTVVKRLWTGTWRASFWVPEYGDAAAAISAITEEARSLGADGVVNLHCLNDAGGWSAGYLCYALAIKLK
jgi:hypothetical protein